MGIANFLKKLSHYFLLESPESDNCYSEEFLLQQAHQDLIHARDIFNRVDPEFIDYAVYNLRAAEERYNSLVKKIKNK